MSKYRSKLLSINKPFPFVHFILSFCMELLRPRFNCKTSESIRTEFPYERQCWVDIIVVALTYRGSVSLGTGLGTLD